MEQEQDLADYRARLLDGLTVSARRSICGPSDLIQVFVNERRVGVLDGKEAEATFQFQCQGRVDTVHLRSEDGVLLGGLSAPGYGFRAARISMSRDAVELRIHNTVQSGSASAVFIPAPRRWRHILRAIAGSAQAVIPRPSVAAIAPSMRIGVLSQAFLVIIVLGLAADRITAWMTLERIPPPVTRAEAPWAATLAEVAKLEQQLGDLARMQATAVDTIQSQQQGMAELQRAIAKLASNKETVPSDVLTVRRETEKRQTGSDRERDQTPRMVMNKGQMDQKQLEAEIHSLAVMNERLSEDMAGLVEQNRDLEKKLESAGLEVSKATAAHQGDVMTARQSEEEQLTSPPLVVDTRVNAQPFLFWVNFSEGTTQERIDQWVNEMQGHKGALNEGWQEVQVVQPSIPTDRFLEQVRETEIVKAVRVSR